MRRSPLAIVLVLVALLASACVLSIKPPYAGPTGPEQPRLSVSEFRDLSLGVQNSAIAAANEVRAGSTVVHGGTIKLVSVRRGATAIQQAPSGAQFPLSAVRVEAEPAKDLYGSDAGEALARSEAVLSVTSAALRGAQVGDVLEIRPWVGTGTRFVTLGAIVRDEWAPAELILPQWVADSIGFTRPTSVVIWGFASVREIDDALMRAGLVRPGVRIRRSWDPADPDSTLGLAATKAALGEFWYRTGSNGSVSIDPAWQAANLVRTTFAGVPIRATCHRVIVPALQGALNEIAAAGLAGAIDVGNTNTYGGCYGPREIRPAGGTTGGSLSRHTWAMALDMNTTANAIGARPTMNCRVVSIFRKWGFAWGGNFTTPDGMHFEWVGEDRSRLPYPSTYCPNPVPAAAASEASSGGPATDPIGRLPLGDED